WKEAEANFKKSIELNPGYATGHHWYGILLEIEGRFEEAKAEMNRAIEINPMSYNFLTDLGQVYYFNHEYDKAKQYYQRALDIYPNFLYAHECLADLLLQTKEYDQYVKELVTGASALTETAYSNPSEFEKNKQKEIDRLGTLLKRGGIREVISSHIEASEETTDSNANHFYSAARNHLSLGNKDKALQNLEQALAARAFSMPWVKVDPRFDGLRIEPRYRAIL